MSTSTIQPTPAMLAGRRPEQLAAATVVDTRCGERHPSGATCERKPDQCTGLHINYAHNIAWTDETLAVRS